MPKSKLNNNISRYYNRLSVMFLQKSSLGYRNLNGVSHSDLCDSQCGFLHSEFSLIFCCF